MSAFAASLPLFGAVVIAVGLVGCAVAVVLRIRNRDAFGRERGRLWMFHGEPDTGPHQAPGTREHDRHVIDPGTGVGIETPQQPVADAGGAETNGGEPAPTSTLTAVTASRPTAAATAAASDDLAAEWEQAVPPMDS